MGIELDEAMLKFECDGPDHEDSSTRKAWFSCGTYDNCVDMALRCGWIEQQGGWICPHCARAPQKKSGLLTKTIHASNARSASGRDQLGPG
jgi:hypothetical protein